MLYRSQLCSLGECVYYLMHDSVTTIVKTYGAHLKASAATVRLRLYDVLALLPPETYEGFSHVLHCFTKISA